MVEGDIQLRLPGLFHVPSLEDQNTAIHIHVLLFLRSNVPDNVFLMCLEGTNSLACPAPLDGSPTVVEAPALEADTKGAP